MRGDLYQPPIARGDERVARLVLKRNASSRTRIALKRRDGLLGLIGLPLDASADVEVRLHNGDDESCWAASFDSTAVRRDSSAQFKAAIRN